MPAPALARAETIAPWGWALVALRLVLLTGALAISVLLYYLFAPFTQTNPVPPRFLGLVAAIAGVRTRRRGAVLAPNAVLLANHVSWLDILALAGATGCAFVAHDGLAGIGPLRWLCELNDTVFIARHERRSVEHQVGQIRNALNSNRALAIFPEGTTSWGNELLPFKSSLLSALESGAEHIAVQPVWLDYGPEVARIAWVGAEPGLTNAFRILARFRSIDLTLHVLAPLCADDRIDRKHMAVAARGAIEAVMRGAI